METAHIRAGPQTLVSFKLPSSLFLCCLGRAQIGNKKGLFMLVDSSFLLTDEEHLKLIFSPLECPEFTHMKTTNPNQSPSPWNWNKHSKQSQKRFLYLEMIKYFLKGTTVDWLFVSTISLYLMAFGSGAFGRWVILLKKTSVSSLASLTMWGQSNKTAFDKPESGSSAYALNLTFSAFRIVRNKFLWVQNSLIHDLNFRNANLSSKFLYQGGLQWMFTCPSH